MKAKIDSLLADYPAIDTVAMGFPRGWENEPLWRQAQLYKVGGMQLVDMVIKQNFKQ